MVLCECECNKGNVESATTSAAWPFVAGVVGQQWWGHELGLAILTNRTDLGKAKRQNQWGQPKAEKERTRQHATEQQSNVEQHMTGQVRKDVIWHDSKRNDKAVGQHNKWQESKGHPRKTQDSTRQIKAWEKIGWDWTKQRTRQNKTWQNRSRNSVLTEPNIS